MFMFDPARQVAGSEAGIMPQVEVKTEVPKVLNKTTPGLQIWRVEVRVESVQRH